MRLSRILAVGALVAAAAAPSFAQGRGGGFGRGGFGGFGAGPLQLLQMPEVQKELKMEQAQIDLIKQLQAEQRQNRGNRGNRGDLQNLTPEERQKRFDEFRATAEKNRVEEEKKVGEILDPKQMARLGELEIQRAGTFALLQPKVQDKLKISADQKTKLMAIQQEQRQAGAGFRDLFQNGQQPTPEQLQEMRKKMQDAQTAADAKMLGVLNADQKKQFDTMKGAPFTFPAFQPGRRRGNNAA